MFETFLVDPSVGTQWRPQGGEQTLHSYGVTVRHIVGRANALASEQLREALPREHVSFLRSLRTSFTHGRFFLCHAGVRPGVPLDQQHDEDLMWIREEFLLSSADFGKIVVHGHTPTPEPEVLQNRINIDTKAFASGRLTCLVLEQTGYRFLKV
jgi:serine/threonine protein phosphatase 1